jgi:hypothetical protein
MKTPFLGVLCAVAVATVGCSASGKSGGPTGSGETTTAPRISSGGESPGGRGKDSGAGGSAILSPEASNGVSSPVFAALLVDRRSHEPVPSARVILAPKRKGKRECTIDTTLTGITDSRGEVRIANVKPGEYVFFYNLSGNLKPTLQNKVVRYGGSFSPGFNSALNESLGALTVTAEGSAVVFDGGLSVANSGFESKHHDIRMTTMSDGGLVTVLVPGAGPEPQKIEVDSKLLGRKPHR